VRSLSGTLRIVAALLAVLAFSALVTAQSGRPKVRAITAFVRLDKQNYKQQLAETAQKLNLAKKDFEEAGWVVETIRITMQPFPEFVRGMSHDQALALLLELDGLAEGHYAFNLGPATMEDSDDAAMMDLLAEFLAKSKGSNASAFIAGGDGIHWKSIRQAAHLIKYVAENSPHSQGNFQFAATAMLAAYTPYFPGSYHLASGEKFAIGLESVNVVQDVLKQTAGQPAVAAQRLKDELSRYAAESEKISQKFAAQSHWEYLGIDPTPTSMGPISIAAAIESFTGHPFGSSGTLSTAFLITNAVRSVTVKQIGYAGMMLPVLEDERLAQRWSEGKISIDGLLSYSSVCATGLDTVPLPGDVSEEQVARILGDVASLAFKWHKPLTARLLPVAGKHVGEKSDFDNPFLTNATLQPLP